LRATSPTAARRWLAGVWLCGIAFGLAQLLRGAHYPSHTMWTAWLCWTLSALMWHASRPLCGMATRPAEVPVGG
jgi:membrane-associated PAP2 superfamily phosphatase